MLKIAAEETPGGMKYQLDAEAIGKIEDLNNQITLLVIEKAGSEDAAWDLQAWRGFMELTNEIDSWIVNKLWVDEYRDHVYTNHSRPLRDDEFTEEEAVAKLLEMGFTVVRKDDGSEVKREDLDV
jgi:hypothetical protein